MSTIAPPPLPDVPPPLPTRTVGYACATAGFVRAGVERPVGTFTRLWLYAPLPVTLVATALLLLKEYASGAGFRHDSTHALVRIFEIIVFAAVAGVTLFVAAVIFLCTWRRVEPATRWKVGGGAVLAGLAGVFAVVLSEGAFQWGKARAYAGVNASALAADSAAMAAAPRGWVSPSGEYTYEARDPVVPAYTRSTGAKWVRVTPAGVFVIMSTDLFAGVREEGFFVPAAPPAPGSQAVAARNGMILLSAQPPVFRYAR